MQRCAAALPAHRLSSRRVVHQLLLHAPLSVVESNTNRKGRVYNCPPPAVPLAKRGEPSRAPVWFPLHAGGTLARGSSISLVFVNFAYAIGIITGSLDKSVCDVV
jgi:hypothetical protein